MNQHKDKKLLKVRAVVLLAFVVSGLFAAMLAPVFVSTSAYAQSPQCPNRNDTYDPATHTCSHTPAPDITGGPPLCLRPYSLTNGRCVRPADGSRPAPGQSPTAPSKPGEEGDPKCAVVNYGPIACPINAGIPPDSKACWVRDPNATTPEGRRWTEKPCNDPAFTAPASIVCDGTTPPDARQLCDPALACQGDTCNLTVKYINPLIKALAALVGIGVTLSIVWAGIQYASSADDPQRVSAAKRRITNALLTLIGFFLFFAFMNWIIPGGIR